MESKVAQAPSSGTQTDAHHCSMAFSVPPVRNAALNSLPRLCSLCSPSLRLVNWFDFAQLYPRALIILPPESSYAQNWLLGALTLVVFLCKGII